MALNQSIIAQMPQMPTERAGDKIKDMVLGLLIAGVGLAVGGAWYFTHQTGLTLLLIGLAIFAVGTVSIDKEAVVGAVKALIGLFRDAKAAKDGTP